MKENSRIEQICIDLIKEGKINTIEGYTIVAAITHFATHRESLLYGSVTVETAKKLIEY